MMKRWNGKASIQYPLEQDAPTNRVGPEDSCDPSSHRGRVCYFRQAHCSDITNDQLGISSETGHGGANLRVY